MLDRETGSSSELGVFVKSSDHFDDKTVAFLDGFTRKQIRENPKTLLTASSVVEVVSDLTEVPGAPHVTPTGEEVQATYDAAPKDVQLSTARPGALNLVFRTGPSGLDARAVVVREIRKTTNPPEGSERHAVGARRGRSRTPRQPRGEPDPPHLPRDPVRVPLPLGPVAQHHPRAALARPGPHRGRCGLDLRVRARPQAQPDDRGRWPAGRGGLHRVHVADPPAVRRGASTGVQSTRSRRRHRLPHRAGVLRLGPGRGGRTSP